MHWVVNRLSPESCGARLGPPPRRTGVSARRTKGRIGYERALPRWRCPPAHPVMLHSAGRTRAADPIRRGHSARQLALLEEWRHLVLAVGLGGEARGEVLRLLNPQLVQHAGLVELLRQVAELLFALELKDDLVHVVERVRSAVLRGGVVLLAEPQGGHRGVAGLRDDGAQGPPKAVLQVSPEDDILHDGATGRGGALPASLRRGLLVGGRCAPCARARDWQVVVAHNAAGVRTALRERKAAR
mmetsp:Transcript_270/g.887  ORF Transcript_270/g.887 Transcript_270/m.887 type:complete len:243 (-) Transcript_270:160-888(-)